MEIHSEVLVDKESSHTMVSLPIEPAKETAGTSDKAFVVEFLPLFGSHILTSAFDYKIEVKLGTMTSNELVGTLNQMSGNSRTATRSKHFRQESPFNSCILEVQLPDVRLKFTSDFFIAEVINFMVRWKFPLFLPFLIIPVFTALRAGHLQGVPAQVSARAAQPGQMP